MASPMLRKILNRLTEITLSRGITDVGKESLKLQQIPPQRRVNNHCLMPSCGLNFTDTMPEAPQPFLGLRNA